MVATVDLLPGEEIVREEPILVALKESHNTIESRTLGLTMLTQSDSASVFLAYMKLPHEKKQVIDALFCPADSLKPKMDLWRDSLDKSAPYVDRSIIDIPTYVRIFRMFNLNGFRGSDDEDCYVFNDISRMSHSCLPNCFKNPSKSIGIIKYLILKANWNICSCSWYWCGRDKDSPEACMRRRSPGCANAILNYF